jgi:dynein heavy chain
VSAQLAGNLFLANAAVTYFGPLTARAREDLLREWHRIFNSLDVPHVADFRLHSILGDPVQLLRWQHSSGLPPDEHSLESAVIVHNAHACPLLIDPQGTGLQWLLRAYAQRKLRQIAITSDTLLKELEEALRHTVPIVITNIEETVDRSLDPLILRELHLVEGERRYALIGEEKVPLPRTSSSGARSGGSSVTTTNSNNNYRLEVYLASKMHNPNFSPDIFIRTSVVNFSVSAEGVEALMLAHIASLELRELD